MQLGTLLQIRFLQKVINHLQHYTDMFPHRRFPIKQSAWGACDYEATELTLAFHHLSESARESELRLAQPRPELTTGDQ